MLKHEIIYTANPSVAFRKINNKYIAYNQDNLSMFCFSKIGFEILNNILLANLSGGFQGIKNSNNVSKCQYDEFVKFLIENQLVLIPGVETKNNKSDKPQFIQMELWRFVKEHSGVYVPVNGTLEITYKCNQRCIHCYQDCEETKKIQDGDTEDIKMYIKKLYDAGCFVLTITGGEPFARKDIWEILNYARSLNFCIILYSNGTLIKERDIERLQRLRIKKVCISLFSMNKAVHDKIANKNGLQEKALTTIKNLRNAGVNVRIHCPILNINYADYTDVVDLSKQLKCEVILGPTMIPKDNGALEPLCFSITDSEYLEVLKSSFSYTQLFDSECTMANKLSEIPCNVVNSGIAVSSDGKVFPCNSFKLEIGNLNNDTIINIWNNSRVLKKLRKIKLSKISECRNCKKLNTCTLCPANTWKEKGDIVGPSMLNCRIAEIKQRFIYN